ncbi:cystathione beta-lyase [Granulicatella balaenopterae]|uniref:cysteine-S-conjugate beta-lyase n=1 Tax=Granulicatella balaenopterae TaxID=137733 RepID=A0A1H9LNB8_9LACT|nr:MalY/PatB family protein [Granulicatella balaenopterae]SER12838.1 cystathione beta-lyase [Granulicatella balaenopterae]
MVDFNKEIDRRGTFCTQWDYIEDRFGEADLLPFTISDMDLESPEAIVNSLVERCQHGVFGYSRWHHKAFMGAVQKWYQRYHLEVNGDWLIYSPSVMYSVAKLINLTSQAGDGVVILTPAYDAFFKTIRANKRKIIDCPLSYEEGQYTIDFIAFEEAIQKAKVFLLCNPHNPTGRVWTKEELKQLIAICQKHQVFIISDDIHMDITYKRSYTPILVLSSYEKMAILTSASKTFNIPALTGSYGMIPDSQLREEFLYIIKNKEAVSSPAILAIIATITAYQECDEWLSELLAHTKANISYVSEYLEEHMPELTCQMPDGCYFAWINFEALGVTSDKLQKALIEVGKVAIMPGNTYGETAEYFLRLNVACSRQKVVDGLKRLEKAYQYLKEQ